MAGCAVAGAAGALSPGVEPAGFTDSEPVPSSDEGAGELDVSAAAGAGREAGASDVWEVALDTNGRVHRVHCSGPLTNPATY